MKPSGATHAALAAFLAPLREIDWSNWPCQPVGLLSAPASLGRRYSNVPPEAVPILNLGVDGCHYAVWVDDPGTLVDDPLVVRVSPADSYPDALRCVAPSVATFRAILRADDDWLLRDDPRIARARREAERQRAERTMAMTVDGMGILDRVTRHTSSLHDRRAAIQEIHDLVTRDECFDALVVARNAVAGGAGCVRGFGNAVASVYRALDRPDYADVAVHSYEPTEADLAQWAKLQALIHKGMRPSK